MSRKGWSLVELLVVLVILGVMLVVAAPRLTRSLEQARADTAAANLRAIWAAQRLYWLENHTYAAHFSDIEGLLDPSVTTPGHFYTYSIQAASPTTLRVAATHSGTDWTGQLIIDESGSITGSIQSTGETPITPGMP